MRDITPQDISGTTPGADEFDTAPGSGPEVVIPATQPDTENVGVLSLRYVDGVAVLVVSGGNAVPRQLAVVDAAGTAVASYTAGAPGTPMAVAAKSMDMNLDVNVPSYRIDDVIQAASA